MLGGWFITYDIDGQLWIAQADSEIEVQAEALHHFASGDYASVSVDFTPRGNAHGFRGALLRFDGVNRTVIYRIGEYNFERNTWSARWPD